MNLDDFEQELKRRPFRCVPPEWKEQILGSAPKARPNRRSCLKELLWPSPVAWGTLAAVWVAIVGINVALGEGEDSQSMQTDYAQLRQAVEQKRTLQAELEDPVVPPKPEAIKPRSQARRQSASA
jgi:hypothetical protein